MSTDALHVLRSIDETLKDILRELRQGAAGHTGGGAPGRVAAPDADLDGKYGDPEVKAKDPRDWMGPTMKGRRFSECPPDYLDMVAARLDYFAEQADEKGEKASNGKPASAYKRLDAARARGWAKRIRDGRHAQTHEQAPTDNGWAGGADERDPRDDDIPF